MTKPIHDETAGQLQVVVSFRTQPIGVASRDELTDLIATAIRGRFRDWLDPEGLTVHIRVIGAGGEASEHLTTTETLPTARAHTQIQVDKDRL